MPLDEPTTDLIFDMDQMKPACRLLQVIGRCQDPWSILRQFPDWLTAPTPGMQRVTGTRAQWEALAAKVRAKCPPR